MTAAGRGRAKRRQSRDNGGTITIGRLAPGRYSYAIHQFSSDGSLAQSGARVQVLRGSGVLHTFAVPAGSGRC